MVGSSVVERALFGTNLVFYYISHVPTLPRSTLHTRSSIISPPQKHGLNVCTQGNDGERTALRGEK